MRILAIDPGPERSAYVVYNAGAREILDCDICLNDKLVDALYNDLWLSIYGRYVLVIEMVASYGMPVGREVFETCVWIGRFMQANRNLAVYRLFRREVKMHLCGSMRAKDSNIRQELINQFGPGREKTCGATWPWR